MKYAAFIFMIFVGALKAEMPAGAADLVPRSDGLAAERLKMKDEPATIVSGSKITNTSLDPKISATPKAGQVLLSSESAEVDGFVIRAELTLSETSSSIPEAVFVFRVTNVTKSLVVVTIVNETHGFQLTGNSLEGEPVAYSRIGKGFFDEPFERSDRGRELKPGDFLEFKLPADELPTLFVAPIESCSVGWYKGVDSKEHFLPPIPGLTIKLDQKIITKLLDEIRHR